MGSDWIMDPILHLVERSSGIIDPTFGSTDMSGSSLLLVKETSNCAKMINGIASVCIMPCMRSRVQTEADCRRREAGVEQSMNIRYRSCNVGRGGASAIRQWGQNFLFISFTACPPNFSGGNNIVLPPQPHLSGGKLPPLPCGGAAHEW